MLNLSKQSWVYQGWLGFIEKPHRICLLHWWLSTLPQSQNPYKAPGWGNRYLPGLFSEWLVSQRSLRTTDSTRKPPLRKSSGEHCPMITKQLNWPPLQKIGEDEIRLWRSMFHGSPRQLSRLPWKTSLGNSCSPTFIIIMLISRAHFYLSMVNFTNTIVALSQTTIIIVAPRWDVQPSSWASAHCLGSREMMVWWDGATTVENNFLFWNTHPGGPAAYIIIIPLVGSQ